MMLSDVCLTSVSVTYIRPKSRTERPRKTKIGTEVAHIIHGLDTTFKVKRSKVKVTKPLYSLPVWHIRRLQQWAWEHVAMENCCYVAVCSAVRGASAPTEGGEGRGHIMAAARLQLVLAANFLLQRFYNTFTCPNVTLTLDCTTCISIE